MPAKENSNEFDLYESQLDNLMVGSAATDNLSQKDKMSNSAAYAHATKSFNSVKEVQ